MIYTELTKKALKLSFEAHKNQTDKSEIPYVYHPFHVAEQMTTESETVVALLHDVVEDTDYTIEDIREMGFPDEVTDALALMTHDKSVPYMDYVEKIKYNPIAKAVKLADLNHNSDLTRVDVVDAKTISRVQKYAHTIKLLSEKDIDILNISFFCRGDRYTCLNGNITNGCLNMVSKVDGGDDYMDSEKHYCFSEAETLKLFSIMTLNEFIDLCGKRSLTEMESYLEKNGVSYESSVF